MIEIRNLAKEFGPIRAVDDISFEVRPGEVLGFLGPNGAGKSTTMKMITGFLAPTRGTALVCGHDVRQAPIEVKKRIGYLPEGAPLYPDMTPESLLRFAAEARGMRAALRDERVRAAVEQVQLEGVLQQRIDTLSKGFKRRVGLALAILHDPEVLILDEPTDGLDPNQKHEVRQLIRDMAQGKVILLSTHILEEVESVCTRAIIISGGKLRFDGTPAELRRRSSFHNAVYLTIQSQSASGGPGASGAADALAALPGVAKVELQSSADGFSSYLVLPSGGEPILRAVSDLVYGKGWEVEHLHVDPGRMDDVFRQITTGRSGVFVPPASRGAGRPPGKATPAGEDAPVAAGRGVDSERS